MTRTTCLEIERLRYWQGQRLLGRDFRDQMELDAHLRWWHNRALHQAYGVRYGFSLTELVTHGELLGLRVGCGIAFDCFGRELILRSPKEVALPDSGPRVLLVRYREAPELPGGRDGSSACAPGSRAGLSHEPELSWRDPDDVAGDDGVPLARLSFVRAARLETLPPGVDFPAALSRRIGFDAERRLLYFRGAMSAAEVKAIRELSDDPGFRDAVTELVRAPIRVPVVDATVRLSRPLARPRVASGATAPEGTAWELWTERVGVRGVKSLVEIGAQVVVDTSAAGFTEPPCYFAFLQGTLWSETSADLFPVPLAHVDRETIRSFRVRLWLPPIVALLGARTRLANQRFARDFISFARRERLYICWLGVQHAAGTAAGFDCPEDAEDPCPDEDEG